MRRALCGATKKLAELPPDRVWDVLGFRRKEDFDFQRRTEYKVRLVLRAGKEEAVVVWPTRSLQRVLFECLDSFLSIAESDRRELFWIQCFTGAGKYGGLSLRVGPSRTFKNLEGENIVWNPVEVVSAPDRERIQLLRQIGSKNLDYEELREELAKNDLQRTTAPENKYTKKTTELPEGEYLCKRFASTTFRNAPRTILFLLPLGEDGEPTTDEETPTHGVFLEKEIAAMGGIEALEKRKTPLRCWLGEEKTTPNKKKCRGVAIA